MVRTILDAVTIDRSTMIRQPLVIGSWPRSGPPALVSRGAPCCLGQSIGIPMCGKEGGHLPKDLVVASLSAQERGAIIRSTLQRAMKERPNSFPVRRADHRASPRSSRNNQALASAQSRLTVILCNAENGGDLVAR